MGQVDYEMQFLLSLDGYELRLASGYVMKIVAQVVTASRERPHGLKYSLTLHDPAGCRIYGLDNAHGIRRQVEYDHRHVHGRRDVVRYGYRGAAELLADFYRESERILRERGAL